MNEEEKMQEKIYEMEEEKIQMDKGKLQEQIDKLERQRMELKVEKGEAFHCKKCRKVVIKSQYATEQEKHQLCYICLDIKRNTEKRQMLLEKFKDATLTDLSLTRGEITVMILETDSKKFTFTLGCWEDDHHMSFDEYDKDEVKR